MTTSSHLFNHDGGTICPAGTVAVLHRVRGVVTLSLALSLALLLVLAVGAPAARAASPGWKILGATGRDCPLFCV